jgi:hypothetical protein
VPSTHPSSVHNVETTTPKPSKPVYGAYLRHSCLDRYYAAEAVYSYLDDINGTDKRFSLEHCRCNAWFTRHVDTGEVRIAANACHLRWCPVCSDSRRNYISVGVAEWVSEQSHPKFLTLTLKHSDAPLSHQVDNLYRCFRTLRRRPEFKKAVPGGIWFYQVKRSKADGRWHPHLHCLICGDYIPHSRLSRIWLEITYTSSVVDIRPVRDPQQASNDAARYAASPGSLVGLPLAKALELVEAMHGRRICGTWGTARRVSLRPPKVQDPGKWNSLGSWGTVWQHRDDDHNARSIIYAWANKIALGPGIDCHHLESPACLHLDFDWPDYDFDSMYPSERGPP